MKKIQFTLMIVNLFILNFYVRAEAKEEPFKAMLPVLDQITILQIDSARVDLKNFKKDSDKAFEKQCKKWILTKEQIIYFFRLSKSYVHTPYSFYYQIPCDIKGKLIYNGKEWNFHINGGATAYWEKGKEIKYFGCEDKQCDNLVIMPTDLMNSD